MAKVSVITPTIRPQGLAPLRESLLNQTFKDFEWLVEVNWNGEVDLNTAMNRMVRRAKGEYIVSVQDWIRLPETALEDFVKALDSEKAFYTAPVGKVDKWGEEPRWDWRAHRSPTDELNFMEWEICCGACPKAALVEIGGFDEELDKHWGFDNVNAGLRAQLAGYKIRCLPHIKAVAIDHDKKEKHPFRGKQNAEFHNERLNIIRKGEWTPYL